MGYTDSTAPQVSRVAGGWILGVGIVLFVGTFGEFGSGSFPGGAISAIVLIVGGGLLLGFGSRRYAAADRANRRYFAENAGTEVLSHRRRVQSCLVRLLLGGFAAFIILGVLWLVLSTTYDCVDEVCSGFLSGQDTWTVAAFGACVSVGAITLAIATLARVYGMETDRWEELASENLRHRNDGPTPGLSRSRWE